MAVKPKAFPKSLGACADLLYDTRQKRLAADKVAKELKAEETRLKSYIIEKLDKDSAGAVGKHHMVKVTTKRKPRVIPEKWNEFYAYVAKHKAFDLLQKRLSDDAIMDRLENNKKIPGVETFLAVDVSLTKV